MQIIENGILMEDNLFVGFHQSHVSRMIKYKVRILLYPLLFLRNDKSIMLRYQVKS
jgi:hypothetical protein